MTTPTLTEKAADEPQDGGDRLDDHEAVAALLRREPAGAFEVVARRADGMPMVIANTPFLHDGTPMPTRYWLVDPALREAVSRIEARGGVRDAERGVDPLALERAHSRYAEERDRAIAPTHRGPRPSGGVGGTARGVKCLHAHLAWWLVGGPDPVGTWVADRLTLRRPAPTSEVTSGQRRPSAYSAASDPGGGR